MIRTILMIHAMAESLSNAFFLRFTILVMKRYCSACFLPNPVVKSHYNAFFLPKSAFVATPKEEQD
jgi:hypothetical protein